MKDIILNKSNMSLDLKKIQPSSKKVTSTIRKFEKIILNEGDNGIRNISLILNEKPLKKLKVSKKELTESESAINDSLKSAILIAYSNIKKYHENQLQ